MLHLLRSRSRAFTSRLTTHHADALAFTPPQPCDLVVTHFFLDCLTTPEVHQLTRRLRPHLSPGALWLLSEFRIPPGPLHLPAAIAVRLLYLVFRLLTGLRTTRLPDHASALQAAGLLLVHRRLSLFGLLTSELWRDPSPPSAIQPLSTAPSPQELS